MRVHILEVEGREDPRVTFRSDYGTASGRWDGDPPAIGQDVDVELDVDALTWGRNIVAAPTPVERIGETSAGTEICGLLERLEPDGVAILRLGSSVMMADTIGTPDSTAGAFVRVTTAELTLTPTGV